MHRHPGLRGTRILPILLFLTGLLCSCAARQADPNPEAIRIATLEKQVTRNEEVLTELSHRLSVMQFMLDDHERAIRTPSLTPAPVAVPVPNTSVVTPLDPVPSRNLSQDPAQLYELAFATLEKREYAKAAGLFRELADTYPEHTLADNALYWLGECYYVQKDYKTAITVFEEVQSRYPKGGKVPDALLKKGFSLISSGDKNGGQDVLRQIIRDYPFTDSATKAEARLKTLF